MKVTQNCINLIRDFEGLRLKPYLCPAGIPTIGIGCTRYDNGKPVTMADPAITTPKAIELLRNRLTHCEQAINRLVTVPLNQNEFDALVSFSFNVGLGNLQRSSIRMKVNRQDFEGAAEGFLDWTKAGGKVLKGLVNRRNDEKALFLS